MTDERNSLFTLDGMTRGEFRRLREALARMAKRGRAFRVEVVEHQAGCPADHEGRSLDECVCAEVDLVLFLVQ